MIPLKMQKEGKTKAPSYHPEVKLKYTPNHPYATHAKGKPLKLS